MQTWLEWKYPNIYNRYQADATRYRVGCREWLRAYAPWVLAEYEARLAAARVG